MNKNILHSKAWSTVSVFSEACVQLKVVQSFKTDEWMDVKEVILSANTSKVNLVQYTFQPSFTHSFHLTKSSAYADSWKHRMCTLWNSADIFRAFRFLWGTAASAIARTNTSYHWAAVCLCASTLYGDLSKSSIHHPTHRLWLQCCIFAPCPC